MGFDKYLVNLVIPNMGEENTDLHVSIVFSGRTVTFSSKVAKDLLGTTVDMAVNYASDHAHSQTNIAYEASRMFGRIMRSVLNADVSYETIKESNEVNDTILY